MTEKFKITFKRLTRALGILNVLFGIAAAGYFLLSLGGYFHISGQVFILWFSFYSVSNAFFIFYFCLFENEKLRVQLERKVEERTVELSKKIVDAYNLRKALLNLAEDLDLAKKVIEEENSKNKTLLESIGEGVVVVGHDSEILLINKAAREMLDLNPYETIGSVFSESFALADENEKELADEELPVSRVLSQKTTVSTTIGHPYYFVNKKGSKLPVTLVAAPVYFGKEVIGAIIVFRDITEESKLDRAKTEFVSLASHQLRTPLSTINWYTEMLIDGDVGKVSREQVKYLNEIFKANRHMVELVDALLNVARLETGTMVVEPKMADVSELIQSALAEQKAEIVKKKLKVETNLDKNIPPMNIDPNLFRIILQNLLSNAAKYTSEGGIITLSAVIKKSGEKFGGRGLEENSLCVSIADTGWGIPQEQQEKIFSKFFRGDNVRLKYTEGTGLGLYIVYSVLEKLQGQIWFHSEENKGSTFYLTIPATGMRKIEGTMALT
ncbi:PAS domain-containing sensor histidine kinase [Patescibacteria group bacterium]|nr:MAG: PAS domain-containing sensor histidine kinase [Patescibacteria group bacterium]